MSIKIQSLLTLLEKYPFYWLYDNELPERVAIVFSTKDNSYRILDSDHNEVDEDKLIAACKKAEKQCLLQNRIFNDHEYHDLERTKDWLRLKILERKKDNFIDECIENTHLERLYKLLQNILKERG